MTGFYAPLLDALSDRERDQVVAAWSAVEYSSEPVPELQLRALGDATLRQRIEALLAKSGRTLVSVGPGLWTSGYRDDIAEQLAEHGWGILPELDRAILTLVLVHSVAIPRTEGKLLPGTWVSTFPTTPTNLRRISQLAGGRSMTEALARLRGAGLIQMVRGADPTTEGASYQPGPQLHRLTPAASRRLQDQLILAAGPATPLAAAIRARRGI